MFSSFHKTSCHVLHEPNSPFPQRQDNCCLPSMGNFFRKILSFSKKFCRVENKLCKSLEYLYIFFPSQLWKWNLPLLIGEVLEFVDPWKHLLLQLPLKSESLRELQCRYFTNISVLKKMDFHSEYTQFVLPQTFLHPTYHRSFILVHWYCRFILFFKHRIPFDFSVWRLGTFLLLRKKE